METKEYSDAVLITWLILSAIWDFAVFGFCSYEVFWRSHVGAWFVFAIVLSFQPTLYEVLKKRFGIEDK